MFLAYYFYIIPYLVGKIRRYTNGLIDCMTT